MSIDNLGEAMRRAGLRKEAARAWERADKLEDQMQRLVSSTKAFLNLYNPNNLPEDEGRQWHATSEQVARAEVLIGGGR